MGAALTNAGSSCSAKAEHLPRHQGNGAGWARNKLAGHIQIVEEGVTLSELRDTEGRAELPEDHTAKASRMLKPHPLPETRGIVTARPLPHRALVRAVALHCV